MRVHGGSTARLRGGPTARLVAAAMLAATSGGLAQETAPGVPEPAPGQPAPAPGAQPDPGAEAPPDARESPPEQQSPPAGAQAAEPEADRPYTVECGPDPEEGGNVCFVDRNTYVGWRTFHSVCHTCHAQDAVGSSFAPNLLERMRVIDKAEFLKALDQGFTGQVGVMPAWGANPNVNKYYEELWSYLRARADGALPPGRPKRMRGSQ
ncbi:MAG TPA: cytochrome c [Gammaproteobacteria bacterium]